MRLNLSGADKSHEETVNIIYALRNYQGYENWKSWDESKFGVYTTEDAIYFQEELKRCGLLPYPDLQVLEIGFGAGKFAAWARDQGFEYYGLETIATLVAQGQKQGFRVASSSDDFSAFVFPESLDLVVAFDVFEHFSLEMFGAWLEKIKVWLKPNGLLVFRMPSGDSPFSRALQHGDLTHQVTLGSSAIHQLANIYQYRIEKIASPALPVVGLGFGRFARRVSILIGQSLIGFLVRVLFHSNQQTVISANMIVSLRKPC